MENISSIIKQNLELREENIRLREENIKLKKEIKTLENKLSNAYRKIKKLEKEHEEYATIISYLETCQRHDVSRYKASKRLVMGNPITIRELTGMPKKED